MININPMMLQQLRQNPAAMLRMRGLNVPQGMNDPQAILNHLTQSGQVNRQWLQSMAQMMSGFGRM